MNLRPFIYKETLHVLRDRRMLFVVLALPVVLMLLFGFAISMEVNEVRVAVAWQEFNGDSQHVVDRLVANPYINLIGSVSQEEMHDVLRAGKADAVVFMKDANDIQVISDASNPNIAMTSVAYVNAVLSGDSQISLVDTHYLWNPQLKSSYNFVPGIMGMLFLLICALMTAVSIVREKETGTMELLLVSPVRPIAIIVSKMVPFFVLACVDLVLIILIARYLLDVPISSGAIAVVAFSLIYVVLALALGLLVSTMAENQVAAMLICGMVMIFPVVMLSGMMYPQDNLPIILKQVSYIVPATWYIDAMKKLMIEGLDFTDVWLEFLILVAMTVLLVTVALKKFKDKLS